MSLFLPLRRATLLIPSGPVHDLYRKHFFILLTNPALNTDDGNKYVLLTSLSTLDTRIPHDPTCLLYPGDHLFVKHPSYVKYSSSRIEDVQKIMNGIASGVFDPKDPMESGIFARICKGLTESHHTAPKILRFFEMCNSL